MSENVWVEMPKVGSGATDDPVRPKYALRGRSLLVHRHGKIYAILQDDLALEDASVRSDFRRLLPSEAQEVEEYLPFPIQSVTALRDQTARRQRFGLGDVVSWMTGKAGISECGGCKARKRLLNRVPVWGWWRK